MKSRRFTERYRGSSHKDAFTTGARISRDSYGMCNGNLCDKSSFVIVDASKVLVDDKAIWGCEFMKDIFDVYGPAGCVYLGGETYLFFGVSAVE